MSASEYRHSKGASRRVFRATVFIADRLHVAYPFSCSQHAAIRPPKHTVNLFVPSCLSGTHVTVAARKEKSSDRLCASLCAEIPIEGQTLTNWIGYKVLSLSVVRGPTILLSRQFLADFLPWTWASSALHTSTHFSLNAQTLGARCKSSTTCRKGKKSRQRNSIFVICLRRRTRFAQLVTLEMIFHGFFQRVMPCFWWQDVRYRWTNA